MQNRDSFCSYLTRGVVRAFTKLASLVALHFADKRTTHVRVPFPLQRCWPRSKEGKGTTWTDVDAGEQTAGLLSIERRIYIPTHTPVRTHVHGSIHLDSIVLCKWSGICDGTAPLHVFTCVRTFAERKCLRALDKAIFYAVLSYICNSMRRRSSVAIISIWG